MDRAYQRADLGPEYAFERILAREDRGDLYAQLRQRRRDLTADEAHADYDRPPTRHSVSLNRIAFGHRPQIVHSRQICPRHLKPSITPTGREQHLLVVDLAPRR